MLYDALMQIVKKKPVSKVTVSDICQLSTVSRATFYRNFDEIPDLLYWKCDAGFHEVLESFTKSGPDLTKEDVLLKFVLRFWMKPENESLLEVLMNAGRIDIIYNSFVNNAGILMTYIRERGIRMSTDNYEFFISVRAGFFVGIIRAWIETGKSKSPDEITEIVRQQHDDVVNSGVLI